MKISKSYDYKEIEDQVTKLWDKEKVVQTSIKNDTSKPLFSFLEGPPTANAPPALHHIEVRVYKDLLCKYKYMQGYSVPRKGGWDCHGLPVEVQVEKKLGLSTKKDVVEFGVGKFNDLCRKDVFTFIDEWNRMTKKMAYWIDLDKPYVTLDNSYMESVWWSLAKLYNKGLLYESHKVVPYCPRCETPLSSHEVAQGYNDVTDNTVTAKFKLKDEDAFVLAWTTTPWTLPANVALAVNPDFVYVQVEHEGVRYILAKGLAEKFFEKPVIIKEYSGDELVGKEYVPLFDYYVDKLDKPAWKIIAAKYVTTDEGTGVVHQAPAFGEDDYDTVSNAGLAFVQPVNPNGTFKSEITDFEGLRVKDRDGETDLKIIDFLEKENKLFKKEKYLHSYPFCWRCDTPLLYYALKSWFVKVTDYKEKLIENNQKINWTPDHIKSGRFGEWLANVKDWALSRNKFWGTPLPIWRCEDCKNTIAIGSIEELEEKSGSKIKDLHKPHIDKVKIKCDCGSEMQRVSQVIDTWYDSGSAQFAQFHYPFENKELFEASFPYSHITEAIDQTRGWFYTLHVLGTMLFDDVAFKDVVCAGHIVDESGNKMSKSKGNVVNPWEAFDKVGVDAVRLQMLTSPPGSSKRFSYNLVNEHVTPFLTILWNTTYFASQIKTKEDNATLQPEDDWVISRANSLIKSVTEAYDTREYHVVFNNIKHFVTEDLSRWYIKLIRSRQNDASVVYTLKYCLERISKLLAPVAPYISEAIYRSLGNTDSVHLSKFPQVEEIDADLEKSMLVAKDLTQAILGARAKMDRGVRWPIKQVLVVSNDDNTKNSVRSLAGLIKSQSNVKKIVLTEQFNEFKSVVKADYAKIGPAFGSNAPKVIAQISTMSSAAILDKLASGSLKFKIDDKEYEITKEYLIISKQVADPYIQAEFSLADLYIDTQVTKEMESEGLAREVARRVQDMRKNVGLKKDDVIELFVRADAKFCEAISEHLNAIKEQVGAKTIAADNSVDNEYEHSNRYNIKDQEIEILFNIVSR